jgi:transcriptional regulator with XRE-family HTH domain
MASPPPRLRETRRQARLSQQALADLVGVAQQHVARYERGVEPRASMAVRLARALGTTVEQLWPPMTNRPKEGTITASTTLGAIARRAVDNARRVSDQSVRVDIGDDPRTAVTVYLYDDGSARFGNGLRASDDDALLRQIAATMAATRERGL